MAETNIKDVKLKIGTEAQFQDKLKDLPINTLVGTTDPIREYELDAPIINKLNKAENSLSKPTNDDTGTAGQVLKKTLDGSKWGDGGDTIVDITTQDAGSDETYTQTVVIITYANKPSNQFIIKTKNGKSSFIHDIKITLGTGNDEKYAELYITRPSSKNFNVNSFTDFKTLIGNSTIGASGFTVLAPEGSTATKRNVIAVNSTQIISNYGNTTFSWSDFTSLNFEDTVTPV